MSFNLLHLLHLTMKKIVWTFFFFSVSVFSFLLCMYICMQILCLWFPVASITFFGFYVIILLRLNVIVFFSVVIELFPVFSHHRLIQIKIHHSWGAIKREHNLFVHKNLIWNDIAITIVTIKYHDISHTHTHSLYLHESYGIQYV